MRLEHSKVGGYVASYVVFQFHKGAIRTYADVGLDSRNLNFNSIKVRLEPPFSPILALILKDFNSIKVRLEPQDIKDIIFEQLFQFHKGAIRTSCSLV